MLAREFLIFLAAAVVDHLDGVAAAVANFPLVAEKDAVAAGRASRTAVGEVRLPSMRRADLVLELGA